MWCGSEEEVVNQLKDVLSMPGHRIAGSYDWHLKFLSSLIAEGKAANKIS